ncbi:hypothetical protein [Thermofilum sp.]|uniref:hypothetical protein n=1 Tax=Thermofilum sp. TaxID=1961369 RepID=UPI00317DE8F3
MKYYIHPSATVKNGKWYCTYCGQELPQSLQTSFPCVVSHSIPFDDKITLSVWNCRVNVTFDGVDISEFCDEKEKERLEKLAVESVESVGGAINWSGIYPPSPKLCNYVLKLAKKYALQIANVKLQEAREEIKKLQDEVKEKSNKMWQLKKAVQRYFNRTSRDEEFLKELSAKKLFYVVYADTAQEDIKILKTIFPEYYKTDASIIRQDFTDDANLLRAGYIIACTDALPCF